VSYDYHKKIPNKVSIKDLRKMTDKQFDNYCSKLKKKLCKSIAADLDFYDFKRHLKKGGF
tara:strand:+ start:548 stop:727 length:180 start_codon:yes stop_codon:yes gene_type:complete